MNASWIPHQTPCGKLEQVSSMERGFLFLILINLKLVAFDLSSMLIRLAPKPTRCSG